MITLSYLSNADILKSTLSERISNSEDSFYPLNNYIAHYLNQKNLTFLKSFAQNHSSSSLTINRYNQLISEQLTQSDIEKASEYINSLNSITLNSLPHYLFIGSKINLKNHIFSDFYPSAFNATLSYLVSTNKVKQFGSGYGSCFLFLSSVYSDNYSDYSSNSLDIVSSINNISSAFKSLQEDNEFLATKLAEKNSIIDSLLSYIQDLQHKNYIASQITWR